MQDPPMQTNVLETHNWHCGLWPPRTISRWSAHLVPRCLQTQASARVYGGAPEWIGWLHHRTWWDSRRSRHSNMDPIRIEWRSDYCMVLSVSEGGSNYWSICARLFHCLVFVQRTSSWLSIVRWPPSYPTSDYREEHTWWTERGILLRHSKTFLIANTIKGTITFLHGMYWWN